MNHTTNYQLSQWESTDRILMSDFNTDNAKIDAALKAHSDAIAGKAAQSTVNSLTQTVSGKANQSDLTAEVNARTAADNAFTASLALKGNCQIYYTTYTGDGAKSKTLTFPRKPLSVKIMGDFMVLHAIQGMPRTINHNHNGGSGEQCMAVWSGNSLTWSGDNYLLNDSGETYYVVALMAADA